MLGFGPKADSVSVCCSPDHLHLFVSATNPKSFEDAKGLSANLIDTVRGEHAKSLSAQQPVAPQPSPYAQPQPSYQPSMPYAQAEQANPGPTGQCAYPPLYLVALVTHPPSDGQLCIAWLAQYAASPPCSLSLTSMHMQPYRQPHRQYHRQEGASMPALSSPTKLLRIHTT